MAHGQRFPSGEGGVFFFPFTNTWGSVIDMRFVGSLSNLTHLSKQILN